MSDVCGEGYIRYFGPPAIEGDLEMDLSKFPSELLQQLMDRPGLPIVYIQNLEFSHNEEGSKVQLKFVASAIALKSAP